MTEVWVTGMSLCSALGPTLHQSWPALLQGKTGISNHQPFPELPVYPLGLLGQSPKHLNELLDNALTDVLADAKCIPENSWGVSVGSSRGYQADFEGLAHQAHKGICLDASWLASYGQSPASYIAQKLQLCGPILSPRAACATGLWAIAQGIELIRTEQCEVVIAGAAEAPITPLTLIGFDRMGALSHQGCYPFDQNRSGFVLGEGIGLLMLERRDHAESRGAKPYGQVLGFGVTCDAEHIASPAKERGGAIAAMQDCLKRSHLLPEQVDYIHAHGTGTSLNDQAEADIIQSLFPGVVVSSTKGATGHTLGASGAIGAIFCLMALHDQTLPPCVGLKEPDFALNLVTQSYRASIQTAACFSFGFGGQNAAIAFAKTAF